VTFFRFPTVTFSIQGGLFCRHHHTFFENTSVSPLYSNFLWFNRVLVGEVLLSAVHRFIQAVNKVVQMASFQVAGSQVVFEFGGSREVVSAERAEVLLSDVTVVDPSHIRLSNKSFTSEAAALISKKLETFKNVQVADISDIIAGRPETEGLLVLKTVCDGLAGNKLIELNVSDNALGAKGVNCCSSLITCKTLQRLYVCNNGLSAEAAALVAELLLEGGAPALTVLHFYNNMSGNGGGVAVGNIVKACPTLEDFRFSATRSSNEGCMAISAAVCTLKKLRKLDLSDNTFGAAAAEKLAEGLREQPELAHLNLRDSGLGDDGTSAVLSALEEANPPLESLDLSGNDLTAEQAEQLAGIFSDGKLSGLKHLSLDDNELESEGAIAIAKGIAHLQALETLSICTCEITANGAYMLARAVASLPHFNTLKIDGNMICSRGVDEMTSVLGAAGKVLAEMEDNDEDGDEEGLDEAIEQAEKEATKTKAKGGEEDDLVKAMQAASVSSPNK
jgi:Ran GTPase-activating protein 1